METGRLAEKLVLYAIDLACKLEGWFIFGVKAMKVSFPDHSSLEETPAVGKIACPAIWEVAVKYTTTFDQ